MGFVSVVSNDSEVRLVDMKLTAMTAQSCWYKRESRMTSSPLAAARSKRELAGLSLSDARHVIRCGKTTLSTLTRG
jgi:hypothetical protein